MKRAKHVTLELIQATSEKVNGKKLTSKQAVFVQEKLKGKSGNEAVLQAYNAKESTARQLASENMAKPYIQNTFTALMEQEGITDEYLTRQVKKGIEETEKHFDYTKLALQLKGKLQTVNINLSHSIKESRKGYDLE